MASVDQMPFMPKPGAMVHLSPEFTPAYLKGIVIHPENALKFDFIIYKGDKELTDAQKREEYTKLTKYFLASLAIPDDDQWVNLSPYEKDRIIKDDFGKTEMGRDLLAQDYMLKQITASLIYPEDNLGKKFWDRVYTEAQEQYGTTSIPVNTFNKVWIVPDDALIYEKGNTAYVLKNHLRVMLEEDYLSLQKHSGIQSAPVDNKTHTIASKIVKEIVLPELEREVNEGKNFATLRQVYSGMLLAAWYKRALKESLLSKIYANKAKVKGVDQDPKTNEEIYRQYLSAYKKGVFNYIKEDVDKYTNEVIPRKYFSGGAIDEYPKLLARRGVLTEELTHDQSAAMATEVKDKDDYAQMAVEESGVIDAAQKAREVRTGVRNAAMTAEDATIKLFTSSQKRLIFAMYSQLKLNDEKWMQEEKWAQEGRWVQDEIRAQREKWVQEEKQAQVALTGNGDIELTPTMVMEYWRAWKVFENTRGTETLSATWETPFYKARARLIDGLGRNSDLYYRYFDDNFKSVMNTLISEENAQKAFKIVSDDLTIAILRNGSEELMSDVSRYWEQLKIMERVPALTMVLFALYEKAKRDKEIDKQSYIGEQSYIEYLITYGLLQPDGNLNRTIKNIVLSSFDGKKVVYPVVRTIDAAMRALNEANRERTRTPEIMDSMLRAVEFTGSFPESGRTSFTEGPYTMTVESQGSGLFTIIAEINGSREILRAKVGLVLDGSDQVVEESALRPNGDFMSVDLSRANLVSDQKYRLAFLKYEGFRKTSREHSPILYSGRKPLSKDTAMRTDRILLPFKSWVEIYKSEELKDKLISVMLDRWDKIDQSNELGPWINTKSGVGKVVELLSLFQYNNLGKYVTELNTYGKSGEIARRILEAVTSKGAGVTSPNLETAGIWEPALRGPVLAFRDLLRAYLDSGNAAMSSDAAMKVIDSPLYQRYKERIEKRKEALKGNQNLDSSGSFYNIITKLIEEIKEELKIDNVPDGLNYFHPERYRYYDFGKANNDLWELVKYYLRNSKQPRISSNLSNARVNNRPSPVEVRSNPLRGNIDQIAEGYELFLDTYSDRVLQGQNVLTNSQKEALDDLIKTIRSFNYNQSRPKTEAEKSELIDKIGKKHGADDLEELIKTRVNPFLTANRYSTDWASLASKPSEYGGIDFNAANLNLQIKRDGKGVPLPISQQDLEHINIDGLIPIIIDIRPATSLPIFSELQNTAKSVNG